MSINTNKYQHLTKDDRIAIAALKVSGLGIRKIARQLGKSASTISRELKRNSVPDSSYGYSLAHSLSRERRKTANQTRKKITEGSNLEKYILKKLKLYWSPAQISGRLQLEQKLTLSHQTIYEYIYCNQSKLKQYLRCQKGKYRRKYGTRIRELLREQLKKKRIDVRPDIINSRTRLGDWEGDTIVGKERVVHILTHVDRKSGLLLADKATVATAQEIQRLTLNRFNSLPRTKVKSITYDNGVQFNKYEDTEHKLGIPIYFAFPYHSWERGTNENTNGLLRQFFPKKFEFTSITQQRLDKVVKLINSRPRKRLNYLTPLEVFRGRGVALRTRM